MNVLLDNIDSNKTAVVNSSLQLRFHYRYGLCWLIREFVYALISEFIKNKIKKRKIKKIIYKCKSVCANKYYDNNKTKILKIWWTLGKLYVVLAKHAFPERKFSKDLSCGFEIDFAFGLWLCVLGRGCEQFQWLFQ